MQDKIVELSLLGDREYRFRESIKTLRTNVRLNKNKVKKILITSTAFREGKSGISSEFAASLGSIGENVLLVDADLRAPSGAERQKGKADVKSLSQYLENKAELEEIICKTAIENVDYIHSGGPVSNPSELLDGARFREMMDLLSRKYDYLIVDTSPIGCVIDAAVIAASCDGIVLVIESGRSEYKSVQRALEQLRKTECEILGAVLNKSEMSKQEQKLKSNLPAVRK